MQALKGLYFVRVTGDEESLGVMYGQIIDAADGFVLVRYWSTVPNEPMDETQLESLVEFSDEAKFYETLEKAREEFIELTRDHTAN